MIRKWVRVVKYSVISGFIAVNLVVLAFDSVPNPSLFEEKALGLLAGYQKTFALFQGWSMFAPNPSRENLFVDADIYFEDGSQEKWGFPRTNLEARGAMMMRERLRKYMQDNLEMKDREDLWLDLSRFVARDVDGFESQRGHRRISGIQFYRHTNYIPKVEDEFIPHGQFAVKYDVTPAFYYSPTVGGHYGTKENL